MIDFVGFGEALPEGFAPFNPSLVERLKQACAKGHAFEVLEVRRWTCASIGECDVVVVDCVNGQVPSRNKAEVLARERLGLVLPADLSKAPQVRALRANFPSLMHMNHVPEGQPASLCLDFQPWATARRSWTPERFLQQVLFWLTGTATGTLHPIDQPVEALYLESGIEIVLPPPSGPGPERYAVLYVEGESARTTLRALSIRDPRAAQRKLSSTVLLGVELDGVVHGEVEDWPATLGQLEERLNVRGASLIPQLRAAIRSEVSNGTQISSGRQWLLLVSIPIKRTAGGEPERVDTQGFMAIDGDRKAKDLFVELGVALGILSEVNGRYYSPPLLGGVEPPLPDGAWKSLRMVPINVRRMATVPFSRQASGVSHRGADERRVVAGVGALGSQLVDLWSRAGWGAWTVVDPDYVQPHNVVRHIARDDEIGYDKVSVVKAIIDSTRPWEAARTKAFRGDVLMDNADLAAELLRAKLIVDVTTTLEVPRELARREGVARSVSAFLTPSGRASAMLLEDQDRRIRLDDLEAQYYGAALARAFGESHLADPSGRLPMGGGCRDVSTVLSNELVQMHAAILARQIRLGSEQPGAAIRVWIADDETGQVRAVDVAVKTPERTPFGDWTIISHSGISEKLRTLRIHSLPRETGGVVIGYIDHPLKELFVVDVLLPPPDSEGTKTAFVRGKEGLSQLLESIDRESAHVVGYVGEWHSHPSNHSPQPSRDDLSLLAHCAAALADKGDPALMIIVGAEGDISLTLSDAFVGAR